MEAVVLHRLEELDLVSSVARELADMGCRIIYAGAGQGGAMVQVTSETAPPFLRNLAECQEIHGDLHYIATYRGVMVRWCERAEEEAA